MIKLIAILAICFVVWVVYEIRRAPYEDDYKKDKK
jgi:hypothetical protein